jgi:hypothetical protein
MEVLYIELSKCVNPESYIDNIFFAMTPTQNLTVPDLLCLT